MCKVLEEDNGIRNFKQVAKFIKEAQKLEFLDLSYNELFADGREEFEGFIKEALEARPDLKYSIVGNGLHKDTPDTPETPPRKRLRIDRSIQVYVAHDSSYDHSIDGPIKINELFMKSGNKLVSQSKPVLERTYVIDNADKIIILGSPEFKSKYDDRIITREQIGRAQHDMDAIRIRIFEKDACDIIPIHFVDLGEFQECFPVTIHNLLDLTLRSMYYENTSDHFIDQLLTKLHDGF